MTKRPVLPAVWDLDKVVVWAEMRVPGRLAGGWEDRGRLNHDCGLLSQYEWELYV